MHLILWKPWIILQPTIARNCSYDFALWYVITITLNREEQRDSQSSFSRWKCRVKAPRNTCDTEIPLKRPLAESHHWYYRNSAFFILFLVFFLFTILQTSSKVIRRYAFSLDYLVVRKKKRRKNTRWPEVSLGTISSRRKEG